MAAEWVRFGVWGGDFCHLRGRLEALLNDFERFFAKIDAFRMIFCKNDAILSGFEQV